MKILGTSRAKDCSDPTHFVANRFSRTKKMLIRSYGKLVVISLWLEICEQARSIINEKITPNVEPNKEMIGNLLKAVHGQVIQLCVYLFITLTMIILNYYTNVGCLNTLGNNPKVSFIIYKKGLLSLRNLSLLEQSFC